MWTTVGQDQLSREPESSDPQDVQLCILLFRWDSDMFFCCNVYKRFEGYSAVKFQTLHG
jgi:hypothetical protein